ncbi:MAG: hypothetical protein JMDDDDMK_05736 [Acidobacteria bacterium]|nr:hypothetical protein [Acidobacteriota bacterium]
MIEQHPRGQAESDQALRCLDRDDRAQVVVTGAHPFDHQAFMLAADSAFGSVRADRRQTEHRVQIKPAERAVVIANAQVALGQTRLQGQRQSQRNYRHNDSRPGPIRIEPNQPDGRQRQFKTEPQKTPAQLRQLSKRLRAVAAFGHVRNQTALEIPVAEPRNLFQKSHAQSCFQPAPQLQRAGRQRPFQQQQRQRESHQRGHRADPLLGRRQLAAQIEQPLKKN